MEVTSLNPYHNTTLSSNKSTTLKSSTCPTYSISTFNCGARGKLDNPVSIASYPNITKVKPCRDACLGMNACQSFSHTQKTGPCLLFGGVLEVQSLVKVAGSMTLMYNKHCFQTGANPTLYLTTSKSVPAIALKRAGKQS